MRVSFLLLAFVFVLALAVRAADPPDDDAAEDAAPTGHVDRLKDIDEEIQRQTVDPDEEVDEPEHDDPFADDPDADDTLPEDRPEFDPDAEPPPVAEPADALPEPAEKKPSKMFPNVLQSPLKESPLHEDDEKPKDGDVDTQ